MDAGRRSTDLGGDARKARWRRRRGKPSYGGADLFYLNVHW